MSLLQNSVSFAEAHAISRLKAAKYAFLSGCNCKNWSFAIASNPNKNIISEILNIICDLGLPKKRIFARG